MLKKTVALCYLILLITSCKATDTEKEVVCFIYHRFGDSRYPTTNTSVRDFEKHLAWLHKNNFRILTFSDAVTYLQSNEPAQKTAVITIDDAYRSFYTDGLPLLRKYKMPATLFINTKTIGSGSDLMDWNELEQTKESQVEIGNHTHSHRYFLNENSATRYKIFKEEIEQSQNIILKKLNLRPTVFSYPYGEFDNEMKSIVKAAGFIAAAAQNSGVLNAKTDLFQCPRFPMSEAYSGEHDFIEKASTRPLEIMAQSPDNTIMPENRQPSLSLTFDGKELQLDKIQCFVQGGKCTIDIIDKNKTTIVIKSTKPITNRRRTLYTVTVPDKTGRWHWHSHLWINKDVK